MKNLATILIISFSIAVSTGASAQHFKDKITKEIKFDNKSSSNVFYLSNINGHIKVEGYDGDKILLEAERILYAKSDSRLAQAKDEISLGVIDRLDTIIVYMKSPCGEFSKQSWGFNSKDKNKGNSGIKGKIKAKEKNKEIRRKNLSWNYNMRNCEYDYDFKMNFTLKVPRNQNIYLSTINQGDITVSNLRGSLDIHNVNGAITLDKVSGKTYAHTINGDVDLDYVSAPSTESYYYTLNGDINAYYPKGLKADLTFKSYNGDFYTNINNVEQKPMILKRNDSNERGVAFKADAMSVISVGGGGTRLAFETFNGDVYLKEKQ